jgi:hypothetical protein
VEPAEVRHRLGAGPQEQVVGVAEDDLGGEPPEVVGREAGHRRARADRHEHRRPDAAVRRDELARAGAGLGISGVDLEGEGHGVLGSVGRAA